MGYHVVQPLSRRSGGADVVVDRGFVAKDKILNSSSNDVSQWKLPEVGCPVLRIQEVDRRE